MPFWILSSSLKMVSIIVQCVNLDGGGVSKAGRQAYRVWWSGRAWVFICLELQCDKINSTYGNGEQVQTKHDAVTTLVTCSQPTIWKIHWLKTVQCTITEEKLQYNGNLSSVLRKHILTSTEISKNIVTLLWECNLIDSMSNVASFQHLWSILASISTVKETFYMSMQPVYNIAPCTKYKQIFKNWNKTPVSKYQCRI